VGFGGNQGTEAGRFFHLRIFNSSACTEKVSSGGYLAETFYLFPDYIAQIVFFHVPAVSPLFAGLGDNQGTEARTVFSSLDIQFICVY
jgi:hypothetical protein